MEDVRWEQRFSNFKKALHKLEESVEYTNNSELSNADQVGTIVDQLIKEGIIQRFEYTHELAWNVMKDYAFFQGNSTVGGSRDATKEAFQLQLINNAETWMDMIQSRNKTTHTYNEDIAIEIYNKIINEYLPLLISFKNNMELKTI
jgi:nucleotidyltransferase substrate binding protein (TIGR01987 family)